MFIIISQISRWLEKQKKTRQLRIWRRQGINVPDCFEWEEDIRFNLSNSFFKGSSGSIEIGKKVKISKGVIIDCFGGKVKIGNNVFIGPYTIVYGHGDVEIGSDCLIGMGCKIISANHTIPSRDKLIRKQPDQTGKIIICNDVWLGADVKVLASVQIGGGSIVGAGSIVNKNLQEDSYYAGVPAIKIKDRI